MTDIPFKFMQPIQHERLGFGYFIGAFPDGIHCQIAIRNSHGVQKNPVVLLTDITPATYHKKARQTKSEPATDLQVADAASEGL